MSNKHDMRGYRVTTQTMDSECRLHERIVRAYSAEDAYFQEKLAVSGQTPKLIVVSVKPVEEPF